MALRAALLLLWLTACTPGPAGALCARNSDCATGVCQADLTCGGLDAAVVDAAPDASTPIQPLPTDAGSNGSATDAGSATADAGTDAGTADAPAADAAIDAM